MWHTKERYLDTSHGFGLNDKAKHKIIIKTLHCSDFAEYADFPFCLSFCPLHMRILSKLKIQIFRPFFWAYNSLEENSSTVWVIIHVLQILLPFASSCCVFVTRLHFT
jgi:hypothetical protein